MQKITRRGGRSISEQIPSACIPLIEIIWNNRVLIENHLSLISYDPQEISVRTKKGNIVVVGSALRIVLMSKERIIICGQISSVNLCGGTK